MQHDGEQRIVDLEPVRVVDEPESLELLHEELHATSLNVHDVLTRGALGEDDFGSPILDDLSGNPGRLEKRLGIEFGSRFHDDVPWNAPAPSLRRRAICSRSTGLTR